MKFTGSRRPSRWVSIMSFPTALIMLGFGVFVLYPISVWFGLLWICFIGGIVIYHLVNAFSDQGLADEVYEVEIPDRRTITPEQRTIEQRLNELQQLRIRGLISSKEFKVQRQRILEQL